MAGTQLLHGRVHFIEVDVPTAILVKGLEHFLNGRRGLELEVEWGMEASGGTALLSRCALHDFVRVLGWARTLHEDSRDRKQWEGRMQRF